MLICNTKPNSSADRSIPLVISWHHKFRDISRILRNYDMITSKYPDLKKVFPNPPMVALRKTTKIKDLVVTAKHWKNTKELPKVSKSLITNCMNITGKITNKKWTFHVIFQKENHPVQMLYMPQNAKNVNCYT